MKVERVTLRGFMRFRDAVTVDLSALPAGLIAIVGPNGAGKTTLLEAAPAALYRSFLSRGDLASYATARDSFLEVQCAVEGRGVFRARVNVDGPRRGSDAVVEMLQADGRTATLNDGKVSTYDQVVGQTFPSKELLLASAFASQNKAGSFISLDKKARKTLFMQLLGIERYQVMSETARQAAALVEQTLGRLEAVRGELARGTDPSAAESLHQEAGALQQQIRDAEAEQARVHRLLSTLEVRLEAFGDTLAAHASATLRISTLTQEIAAREAERSALVHEVFRATAQAKSDLDDVAARRARAQERAAEDVEAASVTYRTEKAAIEAKRAAAVADCQTKIDGNQQVLGMADRIRAAVAAGEGIELSLREHRSAVDRLLADLVADRETRAKLERERDGLKEPAGQLTRARVDAALLGSVPCGGNAAYASCQFLTNATAAAAEIPALETTVRDGQARLEAALSPLTARIVAAERDVANRRQQIQGLERSLAEHQKLARYRDALAAGEARIKELTERQLALDVDATAAATAARARYEARLKELGTRATDAVAEFDRLAAAAALRAETAEQDGAVRDGAILATIERLERERAEAEADLRSHEAGNTQALEARASLAGARQAWDALTGAMATLKAKHANVGERQADLHAKRERLQAIDGRVGRLRSELLEWQLLAKALSRDGLPVLEIDAAGPTISAYTNELLTVCFGARFSVDLVTQQAKADGKGLKEAFTVAVTDNVTGDVRDIADLSGGEQTLVSEALMNGIAIFVNTRSPMPIRTCWRDETTGALDPANAQRYVEMLRKVQQLGGFHQVLFISHNPDCTAMADAQLQIAEGVVSVVYPPFGGQEQAA